MWSDVRSFVAVAVASVGADDARPDEIRANAPPSFLFFGSGGVSDAAGRPGGATGDSSDAPRAVCAVGGVRAAGDVSAGIGGVAP